MEGKLRTIYMDFDSCYYNAVMRIYNVCPWTVITNRFNHMISVPLWLEGHFGVEKITYLASPTRIKLKAKCFVKTFNIDKMLSKEVTARDVVVKFIESKLEEVKLFAPEALLVHKDSIVAEVELCEIKPIRKTVGLPCTIGVGLSEEEAKNDCKSRKLRKKNSLTNYISFAFWTVPMVVHYMVSGLKRRRQ